MSETKLPPAAKSFEIIDIELDYHAVFEENVVEYGLRYQC